MATVVNNPSPAESSNNSMGFFLGMIVLAIIVFFFFVYGLPMLNQAGRDAGTQINVPDKINVDVNQPKQ